MHHIVAAACFRCAPAATLVLSCLAPTASAQNSGFPEGELYVYSGGLFAPGYNGAGIMRVDPTTGSSSLVVKLTSPLDTTGSMNFDPYRQRIVFSGAIPPSPVVHTWLADAAGGLVNVSASYAPGGIGLNNFAPTGDGRIYCGIYLATALPLRWLDAGNQLHTLYDSDGVTPMRIDGNPSYTIDSMIYDEGTNALFVASTTPAPGFPQGAVNVRKLPLSADGTRVVGPVGNSTFEVSPLPPGQTSNETPRGFSYGPNGQLALCILCIDDETLPRMLLVDPVTSAISVFGSNGTDQPPAPWALTTGGVYTTALDQFVVVDTSYGKLRAFSQGSGGGYGTLIPTNPVSLGGFFYYVSVASVPDDACNGAGAEYGTGLAGSGGFVPRIASEGCPDVASPFLLNIDRTLGGSFGFWMAGVAPANIPLYGGSLWVAPSGTIQSFFTGGALGAPGAGSYSLPLQLNNPALVGVSIYFQAGCFDPAAPQSIALTNGLRITIG